MNSKDAVLQGLWWFRIAPVLLLAALGLSLVLVDSAVAAKSHSAHAKRGHRHAKKGRAVRVVGRDGVIHACYKGRGRGKGSVRLVAKKGHCRRGERRVHWSVRGPSGANGANGVNGGEGATGATGAPGQAALETRVSELTTRIETLESTLAGVNNESLTKTVGTVSGLSNETLTNTVNAVSGLSNETLTKTVNAVNGITNTELTEAVAAVPAVEAACTQASALTSQVNSVGSALENTVLGGTIPLGLELLVPGLPSQLSAFACP